MSHGSAGLARRVGVGLAVGAWGGAHWAGLLVVPKLGAMAGLGGGTVIAAVLLGSGVVGTVALGFTRLSQHRRRVAGWGACLASVPLVGLTWLDGPFAVLALGCLGAFMAAADGAV